MSHPTYSMSPLPPTTCPAFLERGQRSIKHAAAALCLMRLFHYTLFTLLKVIARKEHAAHARSSSPLAKTAQGEHPPPLSFRSRFLLICYLSRARIRLFRFRACPCPSPCPVPAPVLSQPLSCPSPCPVPAPVLSQPLSCPCIAV